MARVRVEVDESTYAVLRHGARAANLTEDEFLRLALLSYRPTPPRDLPEDPWTPLNVHATYRKQRTDGQFVRATSRLTITSGPLTGTTYPSPTAAAGAVVRQANPERASGHNDGWNFWKINGTGDALATIRPRGSD